MATVPSDPPAKRCCKIGERRFAITSRRCIFAGSGACFFFFTGRAYALFGYSNREGCLPPGSTKPAQLLQNPIVPPLYSINVVKHNGTLKSLTVQGCSKFSHRRRLRLNPCLADWSDTIWLFFFLRKISGTAAANGRRLLLATDTVFLHGGIDWGPWAHLLLLGGMPLLYRYCETEDFLPPIALPFGLAMGQSGLHLVAAARPPRWWYSRDCAARTPKAVAVSAVAFLWRRPPVKFNLRTRGRLPPQCGLVDA
jgi:hypothetical protein